MDKGPKRIGAGGCEFMLREEAMVPFVGGSLPRDIFRSFVDVCVLSSLTI